MYHRNAGTGKLTIDGNNQNGIIKGNLIRRKTT